MFKRQTLINKLKSLKDTRLIKVVTGVRRAGKSTLLQLFRQELLNSGVSEKNITSLNFDDAVNEPLQDRHRLHQYLLDKLQSGKNYIFLDEVQNIFEYEKLVGSLFIRENIDLYITGSNAFFLSTDLATLLSGRYVKINTFPLSFSEYVSVFDDQTRPDLLLDKYLTYGSFPEVVKMLARGQQETVNDYISGIYDTVITKDVLQRGGIADVTTLNSVAKYLLSTTSNLISPNKIADYLTSHHMKISYNTAQKYLTALVGALIFYRVERQDIRGKQILQTQQKYYVVDTGLRRVILGKASDEDLGYLLENTVYFELLRRRNFVWVGKNKDTEVDFVTRNLDTDQLTYYQVTYSLKQESVKTRELRPLQSINDHHQKIILSTDTYESETNGIKQLNVVNWLLGRNNN